METMTSRERVLAALRREPVDRTPLVNPTSLATVELMDLVDAPFPDANREPEVMARLAATGHTELGFDSIMPVFSIIQESSAIGCKIQWEQKDNWPTVKMTQPIYESPDDIRSPTTGWSTPTRSACSRRSRSSGRSSRTSRSSARRWGPGRSATTVRRRAVPAPVARRRGRDQGVLNTLKRLTIEYGIAQAEAGADAVTLPDHATGDLVSGEYYKRYLQEMHQEFAEVIPIPIILHICGRTVDRMGYIADTGMAAFHYDSKNEPDESMEAVGGKISLVGNVNNPTTLYLEGRRGGQGRGTQEPRGGRADGRTRVRDPAPDPDREPSGHPRGRCRIPRPELTQQQKRSDARAQ